MREDGFGVSVGEFLYFVSDARGEVVVERQERGLGQTVAEFSSFDDAERYLLVLVGDEVRRGHGLAQLHKQWRAKGLRAGARFYPDPDFYGASSDLYTGDGPAPRGRMGLSDAEWFSHAAAMDFEEIDTALRNGVDGAGWSPRVRALDGSTGGQPRFLGKGARLDWITALLVGIVLAGAVCLLWSLVSGSLTFGKGVAVLAAVALYCLLVVLGFFAAAGTLMSAMQFEDARRRSLAYAAAGVALLGVVASWLVGFGGLAAFDWSALRCAASGLLLLAVSSVLAVLIGKVAGV
ncbi:hypothetical protein [Segniliparus rugosus]|uniref:Uncharacterized protein n=1 Tax=Segniliparus rugosus (strain ATCC BAA-974 / DSM 45345 / CCUG 50838 / CIP 108380 / JCM 13579 / CDC 945) TaxID=679197 RepID=E5XLP4_SEGRC|nr:hypothetical protein [Segniliparus rugosus]EFV14722.1 hypothetical protein HMPREF9336_00413 [Segniliparus rugosus ATCC BAA-974]